MPVIGAAGETVNVAVTSGLAAQVAVARVVATGGGGGGGGGGAPIALQVPGRYLRTGDRAGAALQTANRVFYLPVWLAEACTVDRIGVNHEGTVGSAGSVARLGIYTDAGNLPAALVDEATVETDTATAFKTATIDVALAAGLHWVAVVSQPTGAPPSLSHGAPAIAVGSTDHITAGTLIDSSTHSGALPVTADPADVAVASPPIVYLRVA